MNARDKAIEAVHSRICEESLSDHMDPQWPGRCVKAVQAAAPHLTADLAKYKRGAKTLGEIIDKQARDVLDVTGLHHLINEDGDGHWDAVWMRLHEMRDELADLKESTIARERKRGDAWRDRAQEIEASRDEAIRQAKEEAFAQGQKSGMRHAERLVAAAKIGKPELPGPTSPNPYRIKGDGK